VRTLILYFSHCREHQKLGGAGGAVGVSNYIYEIPAFLGRNRDGGQEGENLFLLLDNKILLSVGPKPGMDLIEKTQSGRLSCLLPGLEHLIEHLPFFWQEFLGAEFLDRRPFGCKLSGDCYWPVLVFQRERIMIEGESGFASDEDCLEVDLLCCLC